MSARPGTLSRFSPGGGFDFSAGGSSSFSFRDRSRRGEPFFLRLDTTQFSVDEFLNGGDIKGVFFIGKTDGGPACTGSAGASDPVHIIFRISRK